MQPTTTMDFVVVKFVFVHASRLTSYALVRDEVRQILVTRAALSQQPVPMEVDAIYKGKGKGKDKGKDKGKGKGNKGKGKG